MQHNDREMPVLGIGIELGARKNLNYRKFAETLVQMTRIEEETVKLTLWVNQALRVCAR